MNEDHLLKHADRVIRENQIIREECRWPDATKSWERVRRENVAIGKD